MTQACFFGRDGRALFGMLHRAEGVQRQAFLICAPLLQEGIRSHRMLWALAEHLAKSGASALRFDWFGSGDSSGEGRQLQFDGLLDDLQVAKEHLHDASGATAIRVVAPRTAALPLLAHAVATNEPADIVLWDPCLDGQAVIAQWRGQHHSQLMTAGRYPFGGAIETSDELLGFDVDQALLDALARIDAGQIKMPAASRVLIAAWGIEPALERFIATQRESGIGMDELRFDTPDRPMWEDPDHFETQAFPRRSVAQLAQRLTAQT